jgi:hypothetical protein
MTDYATTGLGLPLLLLAPLGLWWLAKKNGPIVLMLIGMFGAALLANAAGKYPLEGRVSYFMAPVFWLLLAAAFDAAYALWQPRWRWGLVLIVLGLGSSDLARTCRSTLELAGKGGDWRGAYEYVHQHWQEGDSVWIAGCEHSVYRVYYGNDRCRDEVCSSLTTATKVPRHRLWLVTVKQMPAEMSDGMTIPQWEERMGTSGWRKLDEVHLHMVEVRLFAPLGSVAPLAPPRTSSWASSFSACARSVDSAVK